MSTLTIYKIVPNTLNNRVRNVLTPAFRNFHHLIRQRKYLPPIHITAAFVDSSLFDKHFNIQ